MTRAEITADAGGMVVREKIERFASGKFEYEKQTLLLSETQIAFTVAVDTQKPGEFVISSGSLRQLKGIVYSSTSRMKVENPSFLAKTVRIYYTFDSRGMYGSQVEEGFFCLVTDAGEYRLPYRITAEIPVNPEWENYAYFVTAERTGRRSGWRSLSPAGRNCLRRRQSVWPCWP